MQEASVIVWQPFVCQVLLRGEVVQASNVIYTMNSTPQNAVLFMFVLNWSFANNEVLYSEAMLCGCKFQFRHVLSQRLLPMGFFSAQ